MYLAVRKSAYRRTKVNEEAGRTKRKQTRKGQQRISLRNTESSKLRTSGQQHQILLQTYELGFNFRFISHFLASVLPMWSMSWVLPWRPFTGRVMGFLIKQIITGRDRGHAFWMPTRKRLLGWTTVVCRKVVPFIQIDDCSPWGSVILSDSRKLKKISHQCKTTPQQLSKGSSLFEAIMCCVPPSP